MLDITAISVLGFSLFKLLLWLLIALSAVAIGRKTWKTHLVPYSLPQALWRNKGIVVLWLVAFTVVAMFTTLETAYRPKTMIAPDNDELARQLQAIDAAPPPTVPETPGWLPDWEQQQAKNRAENEAARGEFMALPEAETGE